MDIKDLSVDEVVVHSNDKYSGLTLSWSANIGWGELSIYKDNSDGKWKADTEYMCNEENKDFIKMVLDKWVEDMEVDN